MKEPEKKKKRGLSIWIQLFIIAVVAVIIFLIIQNMEPANKNPIKGIPNVWSVLTLLAINCKALFVEM